MADTNDIVRKLIALATNNPSPEEAKFAALKACQLIMENNIPVGQQQAGKMGRDYQPLTPEEELDLGAFFRRSAEQAQHDREDPDHKAVQYRAPDPDLDDGFAKRRILEAWRKVREERKRLRTEVDNWQRTSRRMYDWLYSVNRGE